MNQEVEIRGEELTLLSEKMIWHAARRTLWVADTHFGKAATFRRAGIPVPAGTTTKMLERLAGPIQRLQANRMVILGDFVHSSTRSEAGYEAELIDWREQNSELEMLLIKGNHDRGHRQLFERLNLIVVDAPFEEPPFAYCHYPTTDVSPTLFRCAGHLHPAVRLQMEKSHTKIPCFHLGQSGITLPAFGEFTGTEVINCWGTDQVFVVSDGDVIEIKNSGQKSAR